MWSSGNHVLYREIAHGKVWTARPVTVIQDTYDLIGLYFRNNTHWKVCAPSDPETDLLHCKANLRQWHLNDAVWSYGDTVFLISPGKAHAVHVMWDPLQRFVGWYVNLQEPVRRTGLGFDFLDQELDIVVSPDLDWQWKDKNHLEQAQDLGLFSPEQVRAILQEGQQVVVNIQVKAVPFDGSWNDWGPPTDWSTPGLPEGWDQVG
jgi:hypothetical protein